MRSIGSWIALVAVALFAGHSQYQVVRMRDELAQVQAHLQEASLVPKAIVDQATEAKRAIEEAKLSAVSSLRETVTSSLQTTAASVVESQSRLLEQKLKKLSDDITRKEDEARVAAQKRDRTLSGLPEHIDIDQLNAHYADMWSKPKWGGESFVTANGQIFFSKEHFDFSYVPSSQRLASLKIGKKNSIENAGLIKTWIDEAARAKVKSGYVREYLRTKPADYGEYTEAMYRKGDMYFRTYVQFQRVQGTYARHSLQYTYFVETGSVSRRERAELEQYNKKLGS